MTPDEVWVRFVEKQLERQNQESVGVIVEKADKLLIEYKRRFKPQQQEPQ